MKTARTVIALAACACLPAFGQGGAPAPSSVTVYGVLDLATEWSSQGRGGAYRVISGGNLGSRLGFRGQEELGGGLTALFRIEQGINADDGTLGQGGRAWGREASVGLQSRQAGTVLLGRLPTPYYLVHNAVDAFGWMGSGGLPAIGRSGTVHRTLLPVQVAARADNAVSYLSPSFGGFEARALLAAGEGSASQGRTYGASGRYASGPVTGVLGYVRTQGVNNASASGDARAWVAGGSVDLRVARLFAGVTDERIDCIPACGFNQVPGAAATQFRLMNLGVRVPVMAGLTAMAQYTRIDDRSRYTAATPSRDANWFALGAEYTLSRRTMVYGSMGTVDNRNGSNYVLGSGTAQQPVGAIGPNNPRATTAQVGVRHVF
ncbi:porin [Aquabacterium sp. J223]|uniref:porin n=1 Tax=Aquabacterium sp. J223 TaxID=2898431 RepID=UPI0021AD8747|nr:porin [Aquabacterium sp. J223]UUX95448.1 porin [Aquabacterium sp. J223]